MVDSLQLMDNCLLTVEKAGMFISRGQGIHPTRRIPSYELLFVKRGVVRLWEEDQHFTVKEGESLIFFPFRWHGGLEAYTDDLMFYWIHFHIQSPTFHTATGAQFLLGRHVPVARPEKLESLFRQFLDDQETNMLDRDSAGHWMMLMLIESNRRLEAQFDNDNPTNRLAARAHTFIALNFDQCISPGSIAEALGYNADYLGRVYRKSYGHTITDAINRCRVQHARRLLLETDKPVEVVAELCGFSSLAYFGRVFRSIMKTTPSTFRSRSIRVHINTI